MMTEDEQIFLKQYRSIIAGLFFGYVLEKHNKGLEKSLSQCLMRTVYPNIVHKYRDEPVFSWNDGQWLAKWRELNRFLPEQERNKRKPTFDRFCESLTLAAGHSNLRLGQLLVWLSDSQASELFKLESKFFKLGPIQY